MSMRQIVIAATALIAAQFTGAACAADEKWEISATVELTGMPIMMPSTTVTVCVPPGQMANEKMIPEKDGCKVTGFSTNGNVSRFNMQCPPPHLISGQGQITRQGPDAYSGEFVASGNINGKAMQMKTIYQGRKVGPCDGKESVHASSAYPGLQAPSGALASPGAVTLPGAPATPGALSESQMTEQMKQMKQLQEMYGR